MRNETRTHYDNYVAQQARLNGVRDATRTFSVAPAVEQKLIERLGQSSDFMSRINTVPVDSQKGAKVGVGVTRPIASRTNTAVAGKERTPTDPTNTSDEDGYECVQTNSDTAIRYTTLDAWAHRPEFQTLIRDSVIAQKGRDVIMVGFNGVEAAAETDLAAHSMLQDVNIGWLQKIRTKAPSQHLKGGEHDPAKIYVSATGTADYVNLDALVYDAVELLDEWHRDATDLVAITGRSLVHDKYFAIVNRAGDQATEQLARDVILSTKQLGGLPAARVPFFPPNGVLITSFKNLSYYWQRETMRRMVKDQPERDQIANFDSINDAFVVEDYGKCAFIENVVLGAAPGEP